MSFLGVALGLASTFKENGTEGCVPLASGADAVSVGFLGTNSKPLAALDVLATDALLVLAVTFVKPPWLDDASVLLETERIK